MYVGSLRGPNGFERRVAIKRAHPHLASAPLARDRFVEGARIAARVNHPNAVSMYDMEDLGGELLFIMDYVEEVSLSRLLEQGCLPRRVAGH
jgi:serine/threonine protein kinase